MKWNRHGRREWVPSTNGAPIHLTHILSLLFLPFPFTSGAHNWRTYLDVNCLSNATTNQCEMFFAFIRTILDVFILIDLCVCVVQKLSSFLLRSVWCQMQWKCVSIFMQENHKRNMADDECQTEIGMATIESLSFVGESVQLNRL